jgi:tetratricopeptide (TPR) repeat protein
VSIQRPLLDCHPSWKRQLLACHPSSGRFWLATPRLALPPVALLVSSPVAPATDLDVARIDATNPTADNLGVVNKRLGETPSALGLFEKLHQIIPNSVEVMWQIADLFDASSQSRPAIKWFKILSSRVPTDPSVLARIGNIYLKDDDEAQAFHYHQESYRYFPVNMNVISWLGAYFVKNEVRDAPESSNQPALHPRCPLLAFESSSMCPQGSSNL